MIHSQRGPSEQQAPKPGFTFSYCREADGQAPRVFLAGSPGLLLGTALQPSLVWTPLLLLRARTAVARAVLARQD